MKKRLLALILTVVMVVGVAVPTGPLTATAGGIGAAIFFALLVALVFKPKSKS